MDFITCAKSWTTFKRLVKSSLRLGHRTLERCQSSSIAERKYECIGTSTIALTRLWRMRYEKPFIKKIKLQVHLLVPNHANESTLIMFYWQSKKATDITVYFSQCVFIGSKTIWNVFNIKFCLPKPTFIIWSCSRNSVC